MTSELTKTVAKAVLDAAEIYENSYDHKASEAATNWCEARKKTHPTSYEALYGPDYAQFYRKTLMQACTEANPDIDRLVYLALNSWWNDTLDWAYEVFPERRVQSEEAQEAGSQSEGEHRD